MELVMMKLSQTSRFVVQTLLIFTISLLMVNCDRQITTKDPVRSIPEDLAVPTNIQTTFGNQTVTLTWSVANTTDIVRYRAYTSPQSNGAYTIRDSSTTTTVTLTGLPLNQPIFVRVVAVNAAGLEGTRSVAKEITVSPFAILLNNNDRTTRNRVLTASLTAPATTSSVQLSEDPNFVGAPTVPFTTSRSFTCSTVDGIKTVYVRFTLSDGSTTSGTISDQIELDTRATITSVSFSPFGVVFDAGNTVTFTMNAGEINGTATVEVTGLGNISLFDDGRTAGDVASDGIYLGTYLVPINTFVSNAQVNGTFRDEAGNQAVTLTSSQFLSIATTPLAVTLSPIESESNYKANLSWTSAGTGNFNSYRIYRRTALPITTANSTLIETITQRTTTTLTDTTLNPGTKYFYQVYVFNTVGLNRGSNVDSVSMPANTTPSAVVLAGVFTDSNNVRLSWTLNNDADFATYQIYRRTTPGVTTADQLVTIINSRSTDSFTDFVNANTVYYRVFVFDRHGLSTGSNEVTVITQ